MRARKVLSRPVVIIGVVASITGGVAYSQLGGAAADTSTPDKIVYNQTTGNNGTYLQYVPGNGSAPTKQSVTSGGGCATPSPSGVPLLAFSGRVYPNGYANAFNTVPAGLYKARTGVCSIGQAWSVEVKEGLVFGVGSNSLVAGRELARAQLQMQRQDKSAATDPPVVIQTVLRLGTTVVNTQNYSIAGPDGTQLLVDTGTGFGFTSIEIRVLTPAAGSVSVVGPTSTFTFGQRICGGETIEDTSTGGTVSTGEVTASFFFDAATGVCKSYSFFEASSTDPDSVDGKSVKFFSQQLAGAHIVATFDWGYFPYCRPDATPDPDPNHAGAPTCPTMTVDVGNGPTIQTFCPPEGATTSIPWCTTSKHFDYIDDPANTGETLVHITETWDGLGDVIFRRG